MKRYEDRANDKITERNYAMLSEKYQNEQEVLEKEIADLRSKLKRRSDEEENAQKWLALIRKYTEIPELTAPMLNELIDRIVVHEVGKGEDGSRTQEIEIFFRFAGKIG